MVSFIFIALGWKLSEIGWISAESYRFWSTILGSSASILALLSFIRPPLTRRDLKSAHLDDLRQIAQTASELEELSEKKLETESEIQRLERQKKELELLVSKASLVLHLDDKRRFLEKAILNRVQNNSELSSDIKEYQTVCEQLDALDEEVQSNHDLQEILDIIERAKGVQDKEEGHEYTSMLDFLAKEIGSTLKYLLR